MNQEQHMALELNDGPPAPNRFASVVVKCPEHPDAPLFDDTKVGEQICSVCGFVIAERMIDSGPDWRTLELTGHQGSRVGGAQNPLLNGADLTTLISNGGKGSAAFDERGAPKYKKTRGTVVTEADRKDRVLLNGFNEIGDMAEKLGLPRAIADRARMRLKEFQEANISNKIRSNDATASACLFLACREEAIPRTYKEICGVARSSKKEISRCFNVIMKVLNIALDHLNTDNYVARFCNGLGMPDHVQRAAGTIAKTAIEMDLVEGLSPISVVATAIFMASQLSNVKRTRKEICQSIGIAEATVRRTYKDLYPKAEDLFPKDFPFETQIELLPLP